MLEWHDYNICPVQTVVALLVLQFDTCVSNVELLSKSISMGKKAKAAGFWGGGWGGGAFKVLSVSDDMWYAETGRTYLPELYSLVHWNIRGFQPEWYIISTIYHCKDTSLVENPRYSREIIYALILFKNH